MNADLQGILDWYGRRHITNLLRCNNGYYLSDKEARVYINYCLSLGHTELRTCPEYEDVITELNKK